MTNAEPGTLAEVLDEARELGLLGPGPVEHQIDHARALALSLGDFSGALLDLGSGGGLPGLVLFDEWPHARGVLLDAQRRRCRFLARAVITLGLDARVVVECGRAETLARDTRLRGRFDLVVARSFARPAVTAECSVGFLHAGGALVVTEPPHEDAATRWDTSVLRRLGFAPPMEIREGATGAVRIELVEGPDDRWPRRDGVPAKRPLW